MTDISIQFHALPEELSPLVWEFVDRAHVRVAAISWPPFAAREIAEVDVSGAVLDSVVRRLAFTVEPPQTQVTTMGAFLTSNPGVLILEIGRQTDAGLGESWLSTRTDDAILLKLWRQLANAIRSSTRAGATAMNPATGATTKINNHRFSPGAQALDADGVPILPAAGTNRIRFAK